MKGIKEICFIMLVAGFLLFSGSIGCSKDETNTQNNAYPEFYLQPDDCGHACLYYPNATYYRGIEKTTTTEFTDNSVLAWHAYLYIEKGWKNEVIEVKISGKNIDKYNPNCYAGTGCLNPSKCENAEQYGRVSCSIAYKNINDFFNQDTYTLKVTTSSYGELSINIPLSNVNFLAPVHIISPFDSAAITDKSQLPAKVTLSNGSFTLSWEKIDGATAYSISSSALGLSEYIKENITSYTFKNVTPGIIRISITAQATNSTIIKTDNSDISKLTIEIEAQS